MPILKLSNKKKTKTKFTKKIDPIRNGYGAPLLYTKHQIRVLPLAIFTLQLQP